ncbi:hypothetical protein IGI44_000301 [Enterococcus sp. DIV0756]
MIIYDICHKKVLPNLLHIEVSVESNLLLALSLYLISIGSNKKAQKLILSAFGHLFLYLLSLATTPAFIQCF